MHRRKGNSSPKFHNKPVTHHRKISSHIVRKDSGKEESKPSNLRDKCGLGIVFMVSLAVYWNTLDFDFVHDDIVAIVRNPDVRPTTPWTNLFLNDYWGTPMASNLSHKSYRPITVLTFRLNFALNNGATAYWFHMTNIFIHGIVCALLYHLSIKILKMNFFISFTSSIVFALHPIHTEAVAGITGRSDSLACLLMLTSFILYFKSIRDTGSNNGLNRSLIFSGVMGFTALLAKETGVTVFGINILYDMYIHKDILKRWFLTKTEDQILLRLKRRIAVTVAFVSMSLTYRLLLMNGTFPRFSQQDNPAAYANSSMTRTYTYAFLPVFNAWLLLCPYHLSYDWQMGSIPLVESLWDFRNLSTGIFYFLFGWLLEKGWKRRSGSRVFFALLFISLPFLPASNLLFPVGFVAAERVLYTPSIGVSLLTAIGLDLLKKRLREANRKSLDVLLSCLLYLMLISFTVKTWDRNMVWKSRSSLFESGLRENPGNAKVHYNYANLQKDLGNTETAVKHYKTAIRLWPDYASAHNNLGALAEDLNVAEKCFLRAIQSNPQHSGAHFNLAVIYIQGEKYEEALDHLEECLKIDPSHVEALQYLGACYNVLNKTHQAEKVFRKLISTDLPPSKLHTNFGLFLQELGLYQDAMTQYLFAVKSEPVSNSSWHTKALVQGVKLASQLGSHKLSEELSLQLLELEFDPNIAYMLAINYMKHGKFLEAKLLFERLVEETNSFYKIHYAQFLIDIRRWSEAEITLREILDTGSNDSASILLLATVYENQNRTAEAFDTLHSSLNYFCPQDRNLCSIFYSQLGNLMHTVGAVHSAADYYDMAIKFNPRSVQAHSNIGAIYHLMNNYKEAKRHYAAALQIEPRNGIVINNIEKLERAKMEFESKKLQGKFNYKHD